MRLNVVLALVLTAGIATIGQSNHAQASSIAAKAGDIGRSVSRAALGKSEQDARDEAIAPAGRIPLPALRSASANVPLPPLQNGFQLASIGNEYILPPRIKPRVLDGDDAVSQDDARVEEQPPRPRFVTWMPRQDDKVVPGGRRQACFHCLLQRKAEKHGVPFRLARAIVQVESNYRRDAVGGVGEIGLMQIRPQTARWLGFEGEDEELFNPRQNLEYGVKYLGKAWRLGEGNLCRVILKYNAGHNAKKMNPMSKRYCDKVEAILKASQIPFRQASI